MPDVALALLAWHVQLPTMADDVDWNASPEHQVDRQLMLEAGEKNRDPQPYWFLPSLAHVRHSIKSLCRSEPEHEVGRKVVLEAVR